MRRPAEFEAFPDGLREMVPYGPYRAVVRHIVDGDTIDVLVDLGLNDYRYTAIRLAGIDAPESNRAVSADAGRAAREHLRGLLPVGTPVALVTEPDPDSFGRYIAEVIRLDGDGVWFSVNERMLTDGHAVPYVERRRT